MVFRHPICRVTDLLLVFALSLIAPIAKSTEKEEAGAPAAARSEAKRLFDEGTDLYDRGDYDNAIGRFRQAHRLWPDPLVIFAVAQAQRLKGDCTEAIESYSRFIKAVDPSPVRQEAEQYLSELQQSCTALKPSPKTAHASISSPLAVLPNTAPVASEGASTSQKAAPMIGGIAALSSGPRISTRAEVVSAAGGVLLGGLGLGTYLWNTSRLDRWRAEDAWLGSDAARVATASEAIRRQEANDALSHSIRRYDQLALGLVIAGGVVLATTAVLYLLGTHQAGHL
jgi:tetratricopeptide (TPR) repeat protein